MNPDWPIIFWGGIVVLGLLGGWGFLPWTANNYLQYFLEGQRRTKRFRELKRKGRQAPGV